MASPQRYHPLSGVPTLLLLMSTSIQSQRRTPSLAALMRKIINIFIIYIVPFRPVASGPGHAGSVDRPCKCGPTRLEPPHLQGPSTDPASAGLRDSKSRLWASTVPVGQLELSRPKASTSSLVVPNLQGRLTDPAASAGVRVSQSRTCRVG